MHFIHEFTKKLRTAIDKIVEKVTMKAKKWIMGEECLWFA